jgi:D-glycero-alpha-D-manno-heptose-7-phosphate kinase
MVVSTTIDKYFYAFVNVNDDDNIQITSSDYRTFYRHNPNKAMLWDGPLALPRAIFHHFGLRHGVSMFLASEIPPGTGLGSSSAVAVAIVKAISTACGLSLSRQKIAELACYIEIDKLGKPIGKQDQYAAAFGGLNVFTFAEEGVSVESLKVTPEAVQRLQENILLFFTGTARDSAQILSSQKRSTEKDEHQVIEALHAVRDMAVEVRHCLEKGDLCRYGELLDLNWHNKKRFAPGITNSFIDECYALALEKGAIGGKITGAGGGGFLMLYCEAPHREKVTRALEERGLHRMDFHFDTAGARVLMNAGLRLPNSRWETLRPQPLVVSGQTLAV